jgi:hypothetical protein
VILTDIRILARYQLAEFEVICLFPSQILSRKKFSLFIQNKGKELLQYTIIFSMDILQLCVLGNLCPETVEEAIAMVPSIKVEIICLSFL